MRKRIVAGNWKMNLDHREGARLAGEIRDGLKNRVPPCEVVVIPPFTSLQAVGDTLRGSCVSLGAQDLWYEDSGAFTGEVSAGMISAAGCRYVLVGHSERRHILCEGPDLLSRKVRAAIKGGLSPIYCVGELLEEREAGRAEKTVSRQVEEVLGGLDAGGMSKLAIAYEPVWAIGTGKTATAGDASGMHKVIRDLLSRLFGPGTAGETPILYGGSVKPDNARALLSAGDIDRALVGGASLASDSFLGIVFPA